MISVLLRGGAFVGGGGVLEIAESFGESVVTAAQNPINNLAFGHGVEIVS